MWGSFIPYLMQVYPNAFTASPKYPQPSPTLSTLKSPPLLADYNKRVSYLPKNKRRWKIRLGEKRKKAIRKK
jgi:hypothetical protein